MGEVFVSPLSWGLGHATRDATIIKELIRRGHSVTVGSSGRAFQMLKQEFPECRFIEFPDYKPPYNASRFFLPKFILKVPSILRAIAKEKQNFNEFLKKNKFDMIISDNRFGVYSREIPSFFISHQLRFSVPRYFFAFGFYTEFFNAHCHKHFIKVITPDNEDWKIRLSGKLSQNNFELKKDKIYYAGILASVERKKVKKDIDYFISVSGPEPQRSLFEKNIMGQAEKLSGKRVIVLGKPDQKSSRTDEDMTVLSYAKRPEMQDFMNRARFIITRSGYTTMMELAELGLKKGIFTPTPGQTEQEYLSRYYKKRGWFLSKPDHKLDLSRDIPQSEDYTGFPDVPKTKENVKRLYDEILEKHL
jgi:uncharacterized protein (TIGR00661 family)